MKTLLLAFFLISALPAPESIEPDRYVALSWTCSQGRERLVELKARLQKTQGIEVRGFNPHKNEFYLHLDSKQVTSEQLVDRLAVEPEAARCLSVRDLTTTENDGGGLSR